MELRTRSSTMSEGEDQNQNIVYKQMKDPLMKRLFGGWNTKEFIGELMGTMFLMVS
jgi:hypothetical protein